MTTTTTTTTPSTMPALAASLIRTAAGTETPAAGTWPLGAVPHVDLVTAGRFGGRRQRSLDVRTGALRVGARIDDLHLDLAGPGWRLDASATCTRPGGSWTFHGAVTVGSETARVTFDAAYEGVRRHGGQAWARVTFEAAVTTAGPGRRPRMSLVADVLFAAPAERSGETAGRRALAAAA